MVNYKRDVKRDKEIIRLREKCHMKFPQIALEFGISKARARQLYARIVREREAKAEEKAKETTA